MKRREFMAMLGGAALAQPGAAFAQTPGRIYRLGTFHPVAPMTDVSPFGKILLKVLEQHGYVLGQNLTLDAGSSMGDNARIPGVLRDFRAAASTPSSSSASRPRWPPGPSAFRRWAQSASAIPSKPG